MRVASQGQRRAKIALVGAGAIGANVAFLIAERGLGDVVLLDVQPDMPRGKALDISQGLAVHGQTITVEGTSEYPRLVDADLVIVTAGLTRAPAAPGAPDAAWNRDQLLPFNAKIMSQVGEAIGRHAPGAFVICLSNPVDVMVSLLQKASGLPHRMVVGMGGLLDSARLRTLLAARLGTPASEVHALVLGRHGDGMVPLGRLATVNGVPMETLVAGGELSWADVAEAEEGTRRGGAEIVALMSRGSASFAPAVCALEMATAYLKDERRLIPMAAYCRGEYGQRGGYLGVPAVLGGRGVERILELPLSGADSEAVRAAARQIQEDVGKADLELEARRESGPEKGAGRLPGGAPRASREA